MKVLVDENIPNITVHHLRETGHDVLDIRDSARKGMLDEDLWDLAQAERRLLITTDKGFTEHRAESHAGILIVRLRQPNEQRIHQRVLAALKEHSQAGWPGLLVVVRDSVQSVSRTPT